MKKLLLNLMELMMSSFGMKKMKLQNQASQISLSKLMEN